MSQPADFPKRTFASEWPVILRGLGGALVGGVIGYFVFRWMAKQGLYGLVVPGAMIGFGAGLAARGNSTILGVICAVAAVIVAIVSEWIRAPFQRDGSFMFFVTHLHQLDSLTVKTIMITLGAIAAFWFGRGR